MDKLNGIEITNYVSFYLADNSVVVSHPKPNQFTVWSREKLTLEQQAQAVNEFLKDYVEKNGHHYSFDYYAKP